MTLAHCPICEKSFNPETSTALPFCSPRCREIDLGRWLSERYGLPSNRPPPRKRRKPGRSEAFFRGGSPRFVTRRGLVFIPATEKKGVFPPISSTCVTLPPKYNFHIFKFNVCRLGRNLP